LNIGLYCNWSVYLVEGGFYISPIHARYIEQVQQMGYSVTLLSNVQKERKAGLTFFSYKDVSLIPLPNFTSYISSIRRVFSIFDGLRNLCRNSDVLYIRTFEPFSWLISLFSSKSQRIHFHIIANPLSAIMGKTSESKLLRCIKVMLFYPEYIATLLVGSQHHLSCNGASVISEVPSFFKHKIKPIIESSLVDGDYKSHNILQGDQITFLTVCDLRPAKGIDVLIRAYARFNKRYPGKSELKIVGDGDILPNLQLLCKEQAVEESVMFLGFVPAGKALNSIYRSSDVFVMPSLSETGPRVLLEAMASSLYCISTDVGYAPLLLDGGKGELISPNSVDALISSMVKVIESPEHCIVGAKKSFDFSKQYTLSKFFETLLN
jgi:glycosyltransferase involved in cell wall biosynthesis